MPCFVSVACLPKKGHHTGYHRKDPAFISVGLRNWKKTAESFWEHETSDCPKDYKKLLDMADDEVEFAEQMSDSL